MSVAYLAAQEQPFRRVLVCRLSDDQEPFADTLRNQSWLQSGLRYVSALQARGFSAQDAIVFARRMRASGRELHARLGRQSPQGFGVVRLRDQSEAATLERQANDMGVAVRALLPSQAQGYTGQLYEPGGIYYATPELVFDEAELLEELRQQFTRLGGNVLVVDQPVALHANGGGLHVSLGGAVLRAPMTVLAAGVGTIPMLESIGLQSPQFAATQTPLAVIQQFVLPYSTQNPKPRILVDRVSGYSVVSHPPSNDLPNGAAVLGAGYARPFSFVPPNQRQIPTGDWTNLWAQLPPALQALQSNSRCTAGVEIGRAGFLDVLPHVEASVAFPGLYIAVPGRATLAMRVAQEVVDLFPSAASPSALQVTGSAWNSGIHMHHNPHYGGLHNV